MLKIIRANTVRLQTSGPVWLKMQVHMLGVLRLGLRRVFSGGVMFRLLCVVKLFSDHHTLWMEHSFLQGKGSACWRGLGIHIWQILYLHNVRWHPGLTVSLFFFFFGISDPETLPVWVVIVVHTFSENYFNNITLLLQAWRKYDSDRSGYIESNELKVKKKQCSNICNKAH